MLSDEEKKAIERAKFLNNIDTYLEKEMLTNLLNLIEKQSKEIEELKEVKWYYEISRVPKDKIKAKIEEVHYKMVGHPDLRMAVEQTLQSLLEKE